MSSSDAVAAPAAPSFCHLHVHSEYSLLDGTIRIGEYVALAKERGATHVALTDHGNMHGAVEFYSAARSAGLAPIVGCEVYCEASPVMQALELDPPAHLPKPGAFHLVLLAQDTAGYHNLMKLVSQGYLGDNLREVPVVPWSVLEKYGAGLIALSACQRGELGYLTAWLRALWGPGDLLFDRDHPRVGPLCRALRDHVQLFSRQLFPPDEGGPRYYGELIDNGLPRQGELVRDLAVVARWFELPLVATGDVHYLRPEDSHTHLLALAIRNSLTLGDLRRRLRDVAFDLTPAEKMAERYREYPEAIANTGRVAARCSGLEIRMGEYFLPKITFGDASETPEQALTRLVAEGMEERMPGIRAYYGEEWGPAKDEEYRKRIEYELGVIAKMGFPDYFLIVADFIGWSKKQGIPVGPGRGSGAGSLVAYALRITDLDPLPYTLIFERFLNPERVSMPDFDIDFCQWRRDEVIQYCIDKYGADHVAQITTFGKMQAKGAVKSVGRALNLSYSQVDRFTKMFPPDLGITLPEALEREPRLREEMEKDENLKEAMEQALKLEGLASHTSVHAAGLVISDGPMIDYVPVYTTDGQGLITQYEMKPTEKVGLVKFDFLGLKTLTVIDKAVQMIRAAGHPEFDISKIPMADEAVFTMLSAGHTCGVFQCEGGGMTQLILKLKPSSFEDIIALVALFRPGPLGSGMVDDFIERKHGRQEITNLHPDLEPILADTYGLILYQEQVQKIAATLASYSLGEADLLRRAMGKKIPEEMAKQKTRFVEGSLANGIDQALAEEIFELMAEFAKYGFNKSHSAAYGLVSYQTAYLKAHFPEAFLAASMTCDMDNTDKIVRYVEDAQRLGFEVRVPHVNRSGLEFSVPRPGAIDFALTGAKGVGEGVATLLVEERQRGGPYRDLTDLAQRVDLNRVGKKTLQLLAAAGALDGLGYGRETLQQLIPPLASYSLKLHEAKAAGQGSLFDGFGGGGSAAPAPAAEVAPWDEGWARLMPGEPPWREADLLAEKKLLGVFLSDHPLNAYRQDVKAFGRSPVTNWEGALPEGQRRVEFQAVALFGGAIFKRSKKGNLFAYIRLETPEGATEGMMFADALEAHTLPPTHSVVVAQGQVERSYDGERIRLGLERLIPIADIRSERVKALRLTVDVPVDDDAAAKAVLERFRELCRRHPGRVPLRIALAVGGCDVQLAPIEAGVTLDNALLSELQRPPLTPHLRFAYRV